MLSTRDWNGIAFLHNSPEELIADLCSVIQIQASHPSAIGTLNVVGLVFVNCCRFQKHVSPSLTHPDKSLNHPT